MTEEQRELIVKMRHVGYGYRRIADTVELSRDIVRNYCKKIGLDGRADDILKSSKYEGNVCIRCGAPLVHPPTGRKRKYCALSCKRKWEAQHPKKEYAHQCKMCGKSFKSTTKNQKYCSHDCYIEDRFYKNEQMAYLIEQLKKGEKVEKTPQWIKDLLE